MSVPPAVNRTKLLLATHGSAIAAVLVVVGLLAFAGAAWTVTHPPTTEVTDRVVSTTVGTDVETSTVVTENTTLWDRGTTLRDKPIYPLGSAPELTLTVHTMVPPGQEVRVRQELTLVYEASKDGTVFWASERPLVSRDRAVSDGRAVASTTFDVREVRRHLDEVNAEITGIGRAQARLRLNVTYETAAFSGAYSTSTPLTVLSTGYWLGGSLDASKTHETPVTREVTGPPDTTKALGLGLLGLLSLGGASGVVYASSRRLDPDAIADELDRNRYREWVSAGRLGQFVSGQDVAMDSLKDLVDVAIDSNHRVVHDRQRDLYAVVDDSVIYYYDPYHPEPEIAFEPELEAPVQHDGGHASAFEARPGSGGETVVPRERPVAGDHKPTEAPAECSTDVVAVTRSVGLEAGRLVATYRLETDEAGYLEVDVADTLERECDVVESLRPLEGAAPADTFGVEGGIGFQELASAANPRVVKYVVRTAEPATTEALATVDAAPGPRVRRVVSMRGADDR